MTPVQIQALAQIRVLLGGELSPLAVVYKPSYVMAHIEVESAWNPDAVSADGLGSIGLMQVLPATCRDCGVAGDQRVPANSILAGMRDLLACYRYLLAREQTAPTVDDVVAGYNEGEGNVARGRKDPAYVARWHAAQDGWAYVDDSASGA